MFDCILLCAGSGTRTKLSYNKIFYKVNNQCLYEYSLNTLLSMEEVDKVILVVNKNDYDFFFQKYKDNNRILITLGGEERNDSVYQGCLKASSEYVLIHDGARPNIQKEDILKVYEEAKLHQASALAIQAKDTIKEVNQDGFIDKTLNRKCLWQMQTPQGVHRLKMIEGLEQLKKEQLNKPIYDDVMVFEVVYGIQPKIVLGNDQNIKVTNESDLEYIKFLLNKGENMVPNQLYRIGHSNDLHPLVPNRKLILGGIEIPYELGLDGHSDADCVLHAVTESILGALGLCDIGTHFPDKDDQYLNMDSSYFVMKAYELMDKCGYEINNMDILIYLEKPNLVKYKPLMREKIASLLHTDIHNVNVKATRKEGLGYIGEGKAIEAECVVLLIRK